VRETRSEAFMVRVTPSDLRAIDKAAERMGVSRSEWMRGAAMTMCALEADPHALKALASAFGKALRGVRREAAAG